MARPRDRAVGDTQVKNYVDMMLQDLTATFVVVLPRFANLYMYIIWTEKFAVFFLWCFFNGTATHDVKASSLSWRLQWNKGNKRRHSAIRHCSPNTSKRLHLDVCKVEGKKKQGKNKPQVLMRADPRGWLQ